MLAAQGPSWIEALDHLIRALLEAYGPVGTLLVLVFIMGASFAWRVYNDRRKDREVRELLAEKERTIQRLATQERELRIFLFKHLAGWTDEQVERFVILADFEDAPSARRALEGRRRPQESSGDQGTEPPGDQRSTDR